MARKSRLLSQPDIFEAIVENQDIINLLNQILVYFKKIVEKEQAPFYTDKDGHLSSGMQINDGVYKGTVKFTKHEDDLWSVSPWVASVDDAQELLTKDYAIDEYNKFLTSAVFHLGKAVDDSTTIGHDKPTQNKLH